MLAGSTLANSAPVQAAEAAKKGSTKKAATQKKGAAKSSAKPAVKKADTTGKPAPGSKELEEWNQVKFRILNLFGGNANVPPKETWKDYPPITGKVMVELATDPKSGQQQRLSALFSLANFPNTPGAFKTCSETATDENEAKFYRDAAIGCLLDGFPEKAVPPLKTAAKSTLVGVRLSAVSAMAKLKTKEADAALEKMLPETKDTIVRTVIQQRLDEAKAAKAK